MIKTYKISEISSITGLSIPILRYYEDLGLLKPARNDNNYRVFKDKDLRWIEFISRAKATGMPLAKIIEYSKLREQGDETVKERISILEQQEQILHAQQQEIQTHIDFLQNKKRYYAQLQDSYKKS
ncbi:MerR family transcriptional regulator [Liquorilactobacillus hordei]|uniref:Transcription regulator n=1 Tax=Liquorilactobacillus hordei DSM 19519 TaxID=1423759 RepID=A0A0R1MLY6_9LACO|nr:MerR family transcriptional regulator [Liquorilactobacillus hordei]KRL05595.1 transcription regulator [Liquorilactobacillus hordei DSM 19519]QYH51274.1 MerR family transcriptional regulator [Liquorilactobacillus hordei DSM 19519]